MEKTRKFLKLSTASGWDLIYDNTKLAVQAKFHLSGKDAEVFIIVYCVRVRFNFWQYQTIIIWHIKGNCIFYTHAYFLILVKDNLYTLCEVFYLNYRFDIFWVKLLMHSKLGSKSTRVLKWNGFRMRFSCFTHYKILIILQMKNNKRTQ